MAAPKGKAKQVKVCTLKTWQFGEDIGLKSTEKDGVNYVTSVWCNVCRPQKDNLYNIIPLSLEKCCRPTLDCFQQSPNGSIDLV